MILNHVPEAQKARSPHVTSPHVTSFGPWGRLPVDGPIRVWLDDREIHNNPNGNNPVVADEAVVPMRLTAGNHRLTVAMDLNGGLAWGFTLRWLYADGYADQNKFVWPVAV